MLLNKLPTLLLATALAVPTLLAGCASGGGYNPTTFPYEIQSERLAEHPIRTLVISHVNLGSPSRNYLEDAAPRVDARLARYLKEHGYEVISQREFSQHWNTAVRAFGDPVDPTTGRVNMKTLSQIMTSVRDRMVETTDVDAFLFTDLLEFDVPFNIGLNHLARWDGVSRRPALQGPGSGVSTSFDWSVPAAVASLQVSIYDTDLQRVFAGRGGLDATDAVDTRAADGGFTRRRSILENEENIDEGIALALHPFIEMKNWPGEKP